jgi:hypothetical protein
MLPADAEIGIARLHAGTLPLHVVVEFGPEREVVQRREFVIEIGYGGDDAPIVRPVAARSIFHQKISGANSPFQFAAVCAVKATSWPDERSCLPSTAFLRQR